MSITLHTFVINISVLMTDLKLLKLHIFVCSLPVKASLPLTENRDKKEKNLVWKPVQSLSVADLVLSIHEFGGHIESNVYVYTPSHVFSAFIDLFKCFHCCFVLGFFSLLRTFLTFGTVLRIHTTQFLGVSTVLPDK